MNDYNVGDKVKAFIRGSDDTVIRATLVESEDGYLLVGRSSWSVQELLDSGFEIEILERAPVVFPIPENATILLDKDGDIWRLATGIGWYCATEPASLRGGKRALDNYGPFAVLRPEAETALEICTDLRTLCQEIAAIPSEEPLTMDTVYVLIDTVLEKSTR